MSNVLLPSTAWAAHIKADRLLHLRRDSPSQEDLRHRAYLASQLLSDSVALLDVIHDLRRLANAHTPIQSLPAELLHQIFSYVGHAEPASWHIEALSVGSIIEENSLGYLRIGHVCHVWRQICMGATSTTIPPTSALVSGILSNPIHGALPSTFILAGLRTLCMIEITDLCMDGTMAVLAHAPSLEDIEFNNCTWRTRITDTVHNLPLTLKNLRSLCLLHCECQEDASFDPTSWFMEHIDFPRTAKVRLSHGMPVIDEVVSGHQLGALHHLAVQKLWTEDKLLKLGFSNIDITLDVYTHGTVTETSAGSCIPNELVTPQAQFVTLFREIILVALICPEMTMEILPRVRMLTMTDDRRVTFSDDVVGHLGRSLSHLQILHIESPGYHREGPDGLFHRIADIFDNAVLFPHLQQLWISPNLSPRLPLRLDFIAELLQRRASRCTAHLQVLRLDAPRPAEGATDEAHAAAIEELVPVVIWRVASEQKGGDGLEL